MEDGGREEGRKEEGGREDGRDFHVSHLTFFTIQPLFSVHSIAFLYPFITLPSLRLNYLFGLALL
jgi:hypothetical protein